MRFRTFSAGFLLLATLAAASLFAVGAIAVTPARNSVSDPPTDLPLAELTLSDRHGRHVGAWVVDGDHRHGIILLLHGVRSDRRSMLGRARFLWKAGYSVLLIDQQAHGESEGGHITFGYREADSVAAAIGYARSRWPERKLGVIGLSMGGAAAIRAAHAHQDQGRADAYVLEAVYSNLVDAAENRLAVRLGGVGRLLAPFLLLQIPIRLGFAVDDMSPSEQIHDLSAPILVITGQSDRRTTMANARKLYMKAEQPKSIWVLAGARHQDFHLFSRAHYESRVLRFLDRYLH